MVLGDKIQELRLGHGWTQEKMAEKMCVKRSTYNHWERGISVPSLEALKSLASEFEVSLDELCDFTPGNTKRSDGDKIAANRLKEMGVRALSDSKTVEITVDGLKYVVDRTDLPALVKAADDRYKKLIGTISKGMYQSALTMTLNSGEVRISRNFGKELYNRISYNVFEWVDRNNVILSPEILAGLVKDDLLPVPPMAREVAWQELVEELVSYNVIDPDEYNADRTRWRCPSYRKGRTKKQDND